MATTAPDRIVTLDVVRGIAVMGIFSVNVVAFALIEPAYLNPSASGGDSGADLAIWIANFLLVDGKMRSLFSMLFGASMLLVIDRAEGSGRSGAGVHYRRMVVLALFGLAHFYFIWFGDILFLYAVVGMIAFAFRRLEVHKLLVLAAILIIVNAGMFAVTAGFFRDADLKAHSATASADDIRKWNDSVSTWGRMLPDRRANAVAVARSGFATRGKHMIRDRGGEPLATVLVLLPETLALMLLGMAGFKNGFFTGRWNDRDYRRTAMWGISIGALAFAILAAIDIGSHFYLPLLFLDFMAIGLPFQILMALGYAAAIVLIFRKPSKIRTRFAAVGRAAFTNYLGTSILAMLVFNGDGLGLFERLTRFHAWLFVPAFCALMLLWSKPWLDRFHYGPFEWLWRSLSRGRRQPMRRATPA